MIEDTQDMASVTQDSEIKEAPASSLPTGEALANDDPPTSIGDEPEGGNSDPSFLGTVEKSEQDSIMALQQSHQQLVFQLGNTVLRIFETVNRVGGLEDQIQGVYQAIGKRLNIGSKTRWSVMQDGSVRIIPEQPSGPQVVPPPSEGDKSEG